MTEPDENPEAAQVSPDAPTEEPTPPVPEAETPTAPPQWEYRTGFKVVGRMKEVVNLSIDVANAEIRMLRKKIEKLTYGS